MKQNKRRSLALLLALLLAWTLAVPAQAAQDGDAQIHLRTAQDLVEFSQNCALDSWSVGKTVYLDADIDLSGTNFQPIPIFYGVFYGQGHTISGFCLTGSGDGRGFFRYVQSTAIIQELTVSGSVTPSDQKDSIGGLVGVNSGRLLNCSFQGDVKGGTNVGGVAGYNKPTGQLINCAYSGTLLGEHYVGGIVGLNEGSVIRCQNDGSINITEVKTTVALQEVNLSTIRSTQNAPACTDIGGIAGASSGILQSCTNNGDVGYAHVGYNVGGIAGRQSGWLDGCCNNGTIRGRKDAGGICGQMEPRLTLLFDSDSLDDLWKELDTLQALMDQAITDAEGVNHSISERMDGVTDRTGEVKNAASDLSSALIDWANENMEAIHDVSARIAWAMDQLTPIADNMDDALKQIQEAAGLAKEALDALEQAGSPAGEALADLRLALEKVEGSAQMASSAMERLHEALARLQDALGNNGAMDEAMDDVKAAMDDLIVAFGSMSDAFDELWAALEGLDIQNGSSLGSDASGAQAGEAPEPDGGEAVEPDGGEAVEPDGGEVGEPDGGETVEPDGGEAVQPGGSVEPEGGEAVEPEGDAAVLTQTVAAPRQEENAFAWGMEASPMAGFAWTDEEPARSPYAGGGEDTGWSGVLEALEEMSDAAHQIQSALTSLKAALDGLENTADDLLLESLDDIAAAAGDLHTGFRMLDEAAGHMKDAMDHLDDAAIQGGEAYTLFKAAAAALKNACDSLSQAGDTFRDVMWELADKPEISFTPIGDEVNEKSDALHDAMRGLTDTMQSLNDTMSTSSDILLADMRAINNQFGRVIDALRNQTDSEEAVEAEELVEDISDQATETDEDAGRITNAKNLGTVEGDVNVAGIVGSMAIEYDYDPEDDLTTSGDRSLNVRYQAAALTEACVNSGQVTGKKDYIGGIVGRMDLGTVSQCESYAPVKSNGGDYVGGVAGAAWSTIRSCWARCALSGNDYIGGMAGLGKTVTDCRSLVEIDEGSAYLGAILGGVEEGGEVSGNLFTHDTLCGLDGVSYLGQAEPVDFATLSQGASAAFTQFRLVFTADNQVVDTFDFSYGDALTQLPDIPEKEGYSASWPDIDYGCLTFSRTLEAEYTAYSTALTALGNPPQIVAAGTFSSGSTLSALSQEEAWTDSCGTSHAGTAYTVTVTDPIQPVADFQIQYKLLDGATDGVVWVKTAQGWEQREAELDGTYLVFQAEGDSVTFAVQPPTTNPMLLILGISGGVIVAGILLVLWRKRKKRRKATRRRA